jgi:hypothetical protein
MEKNQIQYQIMCVVLFPYLSTFLEDITIAIVIVTWSSRFRIKIWDIKWRQVPVKRGSKIIKNNILISQNNIFDRFTVGLYITLKIVYVIKRWLNKVVLHTTV